MSNDEARTRKWNTNTIRNGLTNSHIGVCVRVRPLQLPADVNATNQFSPLQNYNHLRDNTVALEKVQTHGRHHHIAAIKRTQSSHGDDRKKNKNENNSKIQQMLCRRTHRTTKHIPAIKINVKCEHTKQRKNKN